MKRTVLPVAVELPVDGVLAVARGAKSPVLVLLPSIVPGCVEKDELEGGADTVTENCVEVDHRRL
jgi:hypothetical protein